MKIDKKPYSVELPRIYERQQKYAPEPVSHLNQNGILIIINKAGTIAMKINV